jgi:hypothetical protein
MGRLNLKTLNNVQVKEQYQVKISHKFAALEDLDNDDVDINTAWKNITENMKASSATESRL